MNPLESKIQNEILLAWGAHPRLRIARINTGKAYPPGSNRLVTFGVPGTADIVGLMKPSGRMIQIEVKTATGAQRPRQKVMQKVITEFGGVYLLVRSLQELDEAFARLGLIRFQIPRTP